MNGTRIQAAGKKIERATLAINWLADCGQQAALATAPGTALSFEVATNLGGSVVGYPEANAYLVRACQEMAREIEARAEALANAHLAEARADILDELRLAPTP